MEKNTFRYQYSAARNREVEAIRKKYIPHEESKLDLLKRLDRRVQSAGKIEALSLGIVGALVFGAGLFFRSGALSGANGIAAVLMLIGMGIMIPAYPIYRRIFEKTKTALTPEILRLSEEITKS